MGDVYVNGKCIRLDPRQALGKGGEADVYRYGQCHALKVWKEPEHPDLQGLPAEQEAARQRLALYQHKLPAFPRSLPARVVAPLACATNQSGDRIVGYTMPLVADAEPLYRYTDRSFRDQGIQQETVQHILLDLHDSVCALHDKGIIIGDFNDLNVLVQGAFAHLIDADSFQFGTFACTMFTARFLDPLLCNPQATVPVPCSPYTPGSDWYAFAVMVMQVLLFVGPYGGIYRPADPAQRIQQAARPLHRLTVFHPEVRYPRPAVPYHALPDDLLHHFIKMFEQDWRGVFPRALLANLRWTHCPTCGLEHARTACPVCVHLLPVPAPVAQGVLTVSRVFQTHGQVICAATHDGQLVWLSFADGYFRRESGELVLAGTPSPHLTFALAGKTTLIAFRGQLAGLHDGRSVLQAAVDMCGTLPALAANAHHAYWVEGDQLLRDGTAGAEYIGSVLPGQTRIWAGPAFGFGFYRAGEISVAFTFDARRNGINDAVRLPPLRGELLEARCAFTDERCWFFTAAQESGRMVHRCAVIRCDGSVEATASIKASEDGWLSTLRGKCPVGSGLFACTDEGIVRLEIAQSRIVETARFPESASYVERDSDLLACHDGLVVVSHQEIHIIRGIHP